MEVTSNHLDVVARGGYGWREEVDDGEEIARRSENFGHPVGKSAPFFSHLDSRHHLPVAEAFVRIQTILPHPGLNM
jgi:hypothetical protein